jgi:hypothetical protein
MSESFLRDLSIKIEKVASYNNKDPIEYVWYMYNTETGIYKEQFREIGLTKQEVIDVVEEFKKSDMYDGTFFYGECFKVLYILKRCKGMTVSKGLLKKERAQLDVIFKKLCYLKAV